MAARPEKLVRLSDEIDAESWIRDRTYERSLIMGPAVLLPAENIKFERVAFSGTPESTFIEIPVGKQVQGVVGLRNVGFTDCVFQDCAIIGNADLLRIFREALEQGAQAEAAPPAQPQPAEPPAAR